MTVDRSTKALPTSRDVFVAGRVAEILTEKDTIELGAKLLEGYNRRSEPLSKRIFGDKALHAVAIARLLDEQHRIPVTVYTSDAFAVYYESDPHRLHTLLTTRVAGEEHFDQPAEKDTRRPSHYIDDHSFRILYKPKAPTDSEDGGSQA